MRQALDLARPRDQRERLPRAEAGRERPAADLNDGVVTQANAPLSQWLLATRGPQWQAREAREPRRYSSALPFQGFARTKVNLDPRAARIEKEQLPDAGGVTVLGQSPQ